MPEIKTQWDLSVLLSGDTDPAIETIIGNTIEAYKAFVEKWKDRNDYLENSHVLKEALDECELLSREYDGTGAAGYYFWLRHHQNQTDPLIKSQNNKTHEIEIRLANDMEFFTNRLSRIPRSTQQVFLDNSELQPYRHFLEKLFEWSKYSLTEPEEKILNLKNQTSFGNWVRMVSEFVNKEEREVLDESGNHVIKPLSDFMALMNSQNKQVRDTSAAALNDILNKCADVAEHEINSILQDKKVNDGLRGMERPDKGRHLSDDMDTETVDVLLDSVEQRFDISQRFYKLKARLMGVEKLEYHERNVVLGSLNRTYSFEKAVEITADTFKDLDPEFQGILMDMVYKGNLDVYPKKGKYGGAFCTHRRLSDPSYVLLNYTGVLNDVTTLAHEMGHAINNTLISKCQNALNNDTPLSTAEVASTFMEDFVFEKLSKEYDANEKLYLIMEKLNDDVSTIFRQVACYRFEQELHSAYRAKNYLTRADIGEIFQRHMRSYMGDAVEQSLGSENWWVYWSHIRNMFYVYSYASGLLISKSLQAMVRKDPSSISKVKTFLSAGLSDSPKNLFLELGIDITSREFWNRGLSETDELLKEAEILASQKLLSS